MHSHLDAILFHETTILSRLDEMARDITRDYADKELTVLLILHGGIFFAADLLRRIHLPLRLATLSVASYHGGTQSTGTLIFNQLCLRNWPGSMSLFSMTSSIPAARSPPSATGSKPNVLRRAHASACSSTNVGRAWIPVSVDYVGFEIEDEFVVGYGLDYQGHYRNLPFVGTLKNEFLRPEV